MSFLQSQYNSANTILKNRDIKIQQQTQFVLVNSFSVINAK